MSNHSQAPVVWLLTDNKPGHKNQLKGLGNRLRVLAPEPRVLEAPDNNLNALQAGVPADTRLVAVAPAEAAVSLHQ